MQGNGAVWGRNRTKVRVTQADIDASLGGCSDCPVALAINRATGWDDAWVTKASLMRDHTGEFVQPLPERARAFVRAYDEGRPIRPFTFFIESRRGGR